MADPQVNARNMLVDLPTWTGGSLKVSGTPVKSSRTPGGPQGGASRPGEHTAEILGAAGLDDDRIAALIASGVAGDAPSK